MQIVGAQSDVAQDAYYTVQWMKNFCMQPNNGRLPPTYIRFLTLLQVTDAVHAKDGKIFLQLWHLGRVSHSSYHGLQPLAPSPVVAKGHGALGKDFGYHPYEVRPHPRQHVLQEEDVIHLGILPTLPGA